MSIVFQSAGAFDAVLCRHWAEGGAGARELAIAVEAACKVQLNDFISTFPFHLILQYPFC